MTITESKRRYKDGEEGFFYEKHKIFLYKEDFNKFVDALNNTVNHVKTELMPEVDFSEFDKEKEEGETVAASTTDSGDDTELKWD